MQKFPQLIRYKYSLVIVMIHHISTPMNIFIFNTYKEFLRAYIEEHKQKGLISRLANDCGCDRTYLSQVLNGKADLTPDHMTQMCDRLGFGEVDSRYLLLLLLRDRSSSPTARKSFALKLETLKRQNAVLTKKILSREKPAGVTEKMRTLYYSSWLYGAVHILTSVPEYQTVYALSQKLQVSPHAMTKLLKELLEMGVVKREGERYLHQGADIYLPRNSPQSHAHHLNWRLRAVERAMLAEDVHYTVSFSVSREDVDKLRDQVLKLIEEQRKVVRESGTEVAVTFCCDFYEI
jgi:uncharacterized protein (TIGR02147 family)